jgi:hypothetical protein
VQRCRRRGVALLLLLRGLVLAPLLLRHRLAVGVHDAPRLAEEARAPGVEPEGAVADLLDEVQRVADEEQRPARGQVLLDPPQAAMSEGLVADRQHLVDQQHVRIGVHCHREAQPHVHAGGVVLDRLLHEVGEAGELDDRVVAAVDLAPREP